MGLEEVGGAGGSPSRPNFSAPRPQARRRRDASTWTDHVLCSGQQVLEITTIGGKAWSPEHHVAGSLSCLRAEAGAPQQHLFPKRRTPRTEGGLGSEKSGLGEVVPASIS